VSAGGSPARRLALLAELALLFVGLPIVFRIAVSPVWLFPALWLLAGFCLSLLLLDRRFERRLLWDAGALGPHLWLALAPPLVGIPLLLAATALLEPQRLFAFPRNAPQIWVLVLILYPILSVYPQGIIYRVFISHRYRGLFPHRWARILVSAVAFSLAHLVFQNWVAPALTLAGGGLFAWSYERSRSSLVVGIQHALFGCWIFTIGLGWHFYHGATLARVSAGG
jgi:membrane protease YdiL (CAAX protease family)